jgi:hypothetical protein
MSGWTDPARKLDHRDLKGLRALKEEGQHRHFLAVCREPAARRTDDGIDILPWELFLARLWNNEYV